MQEFLFRSDILTQAFRYLPDICFYPDSYFIEYFNALRRLNKLVWMINYNGDENNLKAESWGNRVDLSIRLVQFFDHYLKGKPMTKWMKDGIPAIEKGKTLGY